MQFRRVLPLLVLFIACVLVLLVIPNETHKREAARARAHDASQSGTGTIRVRAVVEDQGAERLRQGSVRVVGTVRSARGNAVPNATIVAVPAKSTWALRADAPSTRSDAEGRYELLLADAARCDLICRHQDYKEAVVGDLLVEQSTEQDFELSPGLSVWGTVTTPSGDPIAGATIVARGVSGNSLHRMHDSIPGAGVSIRVARSDEQGEFKVAGLENELLIIHAWGPGLARVGRGATDTVCVSPGQPAHFVLAPACVVIASAIDADTGEPIRTATWRPLSRLGARMFRPDRRIWLGNNVLSARRGETGRHLLFRLIQFAGWPIPEDLHCAAIVDAPGYERREVEVPCQFGDTEIEPFRVELKRSGDAFGDIEFEIEGEPGGVGPYSDTALLVADERRIEVHVACDQLGRGVLGRIPAGDYELHANGIQNRRYIATAGQKTVWRLKPRFGIVIVRLKEGARFGGWATRAVHGHAAEILRPGAPIRLNQYSVSLAHFDWPLGMGLEQQQEYSLPLPAGKWTVELFRPGLQPIRVFVDVTAMSRQVHEVVPQPTIDPSWPPWK